MKLFPIKYRLVKISNTEHNNRYSIQKKIWIFPWYEIDYEYDESLADMDFNRIVYGPKIEILKEVTK